MFKLRSLSLAVGLLLGLIIGSNPTASYTLPPSKALRVATTQGVPSATVDPIDLGWLTAAKESTVVVVTPFGHGSGVVVYRELNWAYVLTAQHIIKGLSDGFSDLIIAFAAGDMDFETQGTILRRSSCYDLALIKASDPRGLLKPVELGECSHSQYVIAMGYPQDFYPACVSIGEVVGYEEEGCCYYIRHSAPIWYGNSGGPLFNLNGKLIGINVMIDGYNNHAASDRGYAVSLEDIREFIQG